VREDAEARVLESRARRREQAEVLERAFRENVIVTRLNYGQVVAGED